VKSEKRIKMETLLNVEIGLRLKKIRETFCLGQSRMSRILNISKSDYSQMESGKVFPGLRECIILNKTFDINADWLFSGSGEKFSTGFLQSLLMDRDKETVKPGEAGDELERGHIQDLLYFMNKSRVIFHKVMTLFCSLVSSRKK